VKFHPGALVQDCDFAAWARAGTRCNLAETPFGKFSYIVNDVEPELVRVQWLPDQFSVYYRRCGTHQIHAQTF
jgi:hypothetical protein